MSIVDRLVDLGLATDESHARQLIADRCVIVKGSLVDNPARMVAPGDPVVISQRDRFVSRGGLKLEAALNHFGIDVHGRVVLDVGASTGGFTDCVLQAGAEQVYALDVGRTQLHERLQHDNRVVVVDEFNARDLGVPDAHAARGMPTSFDLVVVDVSFISVTKIANALCSVLTTSSDLVVLVKPQFEATKEEADRGAGVITSSLVHERVLDEVRSAFRLLGCDACGVVESPVKGASGNAEFLVHFRMRP